MKKVIVSAFALLCVCLFAACSAKPAENITTTASTDVVSATEVTVSPTEPEVEPPAPEYINIAIPETGLVTTEMTVIETKYVTYKIAPDIYVVPDIVSLTDTMCAELENVTGRTFMGGRHYLRPVVYVERPDLTVYTQVDKDTECGAAYAFQNELHICPGDLVIGKGYTLIHELSHVLTYCYCGNHAGTHLMEGFAMYATQLTLEKLEKDAPDVAAAYAPSFWNMSDACLNSENSIYKKDIEYWIRNGFDDAPNGSYASGMRLMAYCDDVYGSFSAWMDTADNYSADPATGSLTPDNQIAVLKRTYGEDSLDGFYDWLKKNKNRFVTEGVWDISNIRNFDIMPFFCAISSRTKLVDYADMPVKYNDLTIRLDRLRFYLETYKGRDASELVLSTDVDAQLYGADGMMLRSEKGDGISLDGVSFIKLPGEGTLEIFEITGY